MTSFLSKGTLYSVLLTIREYLDGQKTAQKKGNPPEDTFMGRKMPKRKEILYEKPFSGFYVWPVWK